MQQVSYSKKQLAIDAASIYLQRHDAVIIATGYICEAGSIDLVFREDNDLVFSVVKAADGFTIPDDHLSASDMTRMETVAASFLDSHDLPSSSIRFDTISMAMLSNGRMLLKHHRDALGGAREPHLEQRSTEEKRKPEQQKPRTQKAKKDRGRER